MEITVKDFTEKNAREVCRWNYAPPYDIYNCPDWEMIQKENWDMADDQKRKELFYSVYQEDLFIGFFRLMDEGAHVMIGLGLRPDYCGKGYGNAMMEQIITTAADRYGSAPLRLEVRTFNKRAIKCYENAGFLKIGAYSRNTPAGTGGFILMERRI